MYWSITTENVFFTHHEVNQFRELLKCSEHLLDLINQPAMYVSVVRGFCYRFLRRRVRWYSRRPQTFVHAITSEHHLLFFARLMP